MAHALNADYDTTLRPQSHRIVADPAAHLVRLEHASGDEAIGQLGEEGGGERLDGCPLDPVAVGVHPVLRGRGGGGGAVEGEEAAAAAAAAAAAGGGGGKACGRGRGGGGGGSTHRSGHNSSARAEAG